MSLEQIYGRAFLQARRCGKARHKHPRNIRRRQAHRQRRLRRILRRTLVTKQMVRTAHVRPQQRYYSIWTFRQLSSKGTIQPSWVGGAGGAAKTKRKQLQSTNTTDFTRLEAVEAATRTIQLGMQQEKDLPGALQSYHATSVRQFWESRCYANRANVHLPAVARSVALWNKARAEHQGVHGGSTSFGTWASLGLGW